MFTLNYHPAARAGIISIPANMKARISKAIETRLATAPDKYGKPLRGSLAGHIVSVHGDVRERHLYPGEDRRGLQCGVVRPTSVMGASKRLGEMVLRSLAGKSSTKFMSVRFGLCWGAPAAW